MKLNNSKARKQISHYILENYDEIKVSPGKCRFNFKCHNNAVHEAKKNQHKKLAMCVYFDDGYPIIHFINYKKGKFIDNTLGEWSSQVDFYFIDWIYDRDMWNIDNIFSDFRVKLGENLSWWVRLTSNYRG